MRFLWLILLFLSLLVGVGCREGNRPRVIVLGIDGADPELLQRFMTEGKLPNFTALAKRGGFIPLGTMNPPQSPVAWASFTTGLDPGGHGIFDFIHRDPKTMMPIPSLTSLDSSGRPLLMRRGRPFWGALSDRGIPVRMIKIAANYPATKLPGEVLPEMGTPDLLGSYGTFTYYTEAEESPPEDLSGGRFVRVAERNGVIRASVVGPQEEALRLMIYRAPKSAVIEMGERRVLLNAGEWSDWVSLEFPSGSGMVRFYLKACRPELKLYMSPVNIDPCDPAVPLSEPAGLARHFCRCCGPYYTQGMPEDTKALVHGVLNDQEFLQQSELVTTERWRLFEQGLSEFQEGLFFFYLSSPDIVSHLFWNVDDVQHPGYQRGGRTEGETAIEKAYLEADKFVGRALKECDSRTTLLVMSDHGFAPFYRSFNLNSWLAEKGYFEPSDWSKTRAYGVGFNSLYLNLQGREMEGIVNSEQAEELLTRLQDELLAQTDPKTGRPIFKAVYRSTELYHGLEKANAPDLVLGYNRGYRSSWKSALGETEDTVLADNLEVWSGDHLMDASVVPGVLLSNRALPEGGATLLDLAPTILGLFDVEAPGEWSGRDLLR